VREDIAGGAQDAPFLDVGGVLVLVDRATGVEVDHRLELEVGAGGQGHEALQDHRTELLDPHNDTIGGTGQPRLHGGLGEMGVQHHPRPGRDAWLGDLLLQPIGPVEQPDYVVGVGQPPERLGAQLVAGLAARQVRSLGQGVGDPVHHGVEPRGVAGGDPGEHRAQAVLVGTADHQAATPTPILLDLLGVLGISTKHCGLGDRQNPGWGLVDGHGDGGVDLADLVAVQVPRHARDLATYPHRALAGAQP
jgi:hypothetical protein